MQLPSPQQVVQSIPKLAREYCSFIEKTLKGKTVFTDLKTLLSVSYLVFSLLEYNYQGGDRPNIKRINSTRIRKGLERLLKKDAFYYEIFDPRTKTKPIPASLADDLADIYVDFKEGLEVFARRTKTSKIDALNVWCQNFEIHTGNHIVSALRTVHWILYGEKKN